MKKHACQNQKTKEQFPPSLPSSVLHDHRNVRISPYFLHVIPYWRGGEKRFNTKSLCNKTVERMNNRPCAQPGRPSSSEESAGSHTPSLHEFVPRPRIEITEASVPARTLHADFNDTPASNLCSEISGGYRGPIPGPTN